MTRRGPLLGIVLCLLLGPLGGAASAATLFGPATAIPFGPVPDSPFDETAYHGAAADIDGDGDLDVVTTGSGAHPGAIQRFVNDGAGHFTPVDPALPFPDPPGEPVLADFDGDGAVDLALAYDVAPSDAFVLWGDGQGGFGPPERLSNGYMGDVEALAAGDMDHDGLTDLVAVSATEIDVAYSQGRFRSFFTGTRLPRRTEGEPQVIVRDLDGDRRPEVVVGDSQRVAVLRNRGGRELVPAWSTALPVARVLDMALGDLTGDGLVDLAVGTDGAYICEDVCEGAETPPADALPRLEVLAGDGSGRFTRIRDTYVNRDNTAVAIADVDGDGHLDLIHTYGWTTDDDHDVVVETWRGRTEHGLGAAGAGYVGPWVPWLVARDFTGDGRADLFAGEMFYDEVAVSLANGPLPGAWATRTLSARATGPLTLGTLRRGVAYDVTVEGTYSPWDRSLYADPTGRFAACGDADPLWRRAADAEVLFAAVVRGSCAGQVLPRSGTAFQLDMGTGFTHLAPAAADPAQHVYTYRVTGTGAPLRARLTDATPGDNSGGLAITVAPATGSGL